MYREKLHGKQIEQLFEAILSLETNDETYHFFHDLATVNEVQAFAQRFQVAKMLKEGYTYQAIEKDTKASTATISRVKRSIEYGNDGYDVVLKRMAHK